MRHSNRNFLKREYFGPCRLISLALMKACFSEMWVPAKDALSTLGMRVWTGAIDPMRSSVTSGSLLDSRHSELESRRIRVNNRSTVETVLQFEGCYDVYRRIGGALTLCHSLLRNADCSEGR